MKKRSGILDELQDRLEEEGVVASKREIGVAFLKLLFMSAKRKLGFGLVKGDAGKWKCHYTLEKRMGDIDLCKSPEERLAFLANINPYEILEGEDNCLLNTGINEIWDLVTGVVSGADHIYDNSHAQIGVGEDNTAAAASQTDLQGSSKTYKGMEATFPTSTTQKVTFNSSFGGAEANNVWAEWVVKQSTSAICLNRKVAAMGTKASGSTWTLEVTITLS